VTVADRVCIYSDASRLYAVLYISTSKRALADGA
jgi:hypothetical protein